MVTETQSEAQAQHCLAPRLYSYPVVKAAIDQLSEGYTQGKTYRGLGPLLGLAESYVSAAAGAMQPLVHKIEPQLTSAEKVACGYLDAVDEKYPSVKSEPSEIVEATKAYYNDTRLKTGVDFTVSTANKVYSMPQVGKAYYEQKKDAAFATVYTTVDAAVAAMTKQVHSVLDAAESALDGIAAGSSGVDKVSGQEKDQEPIKERISNITSRAAGEVNANVSRHLETVKTATSGAMENLANATVVLDYMKAQQEWARETMASFKDETLKAVVATRQRVTDFASKIRSIDSLQQDVNKAALSHFERLQESLHAFLNYVNDQVIPSTPDSEARTEDTFQDAAGEFEESSANSAAAGKHESYADVVKE